jgi:hypothetical protein
MQSRTFALPTIPTSGNTKERFSRLFGRYSLDQDATMGRENWLAAYRILCSRAGIPADDCEKLWRELPDLGRWGIWWEYQRTAGNSDCS